MPRAPTIALTLCALTLGGCPEEGGGADGAAPVDAALADVVLEVDATILRDASFPQVDAGPGCGAVPVTGECDAQGVLRWCEDGEVAQANCAALGLSCGLEPDLGGYWCLAGPGQSCQDWPCFHELTCSSHRICIGVLDGGAEDGAPREDASADAGAEDHPAVSG